jgi:hypothetical protein
MNSYSRQKEQYDEQRHRAQHKTYFPTQTFHISHLTLENKNKIPSQWMRVVCRVAAVNPTPAWAKGGRVVAGTRGKTVTRRLVQP